MAIKKKSVKSKKSAVKKKTAMKKATGRGPAKVTVKKSTAKKAPMKKVTAKKPAVKKPAAKKPATKKKATRKAVKGNPAAARAKALRIELAAVKAELKASQKRETGLTKLVGSMEKSVAGLVNKALTNLERSLKAKPRKRRARKAKI